MSTRDYMARKLQELRKANGLSVNEVGKAVSKSGKTISAWEVGRGQPDADMLVALCRLYGARISDFYEPDPAGSESSLSPDENALLGSYRQLNDRGKSIAVDMLDTMFRSGKYE